MKIEDVLKSDKKYHTYERVILNLVYNTILIENIEESIFGRFGLTRAQYNVLRILRGSKGTTLNLFDIQDRMLKKMSNTTRLVDKLVTLELVHRETNPDNRRKVEISITSNGLDLLEKIDPVLEIKHKERLQKLSEEEQTTLISLLEKMR